MGLLSVQRQFSSADSIRPIFEGTLDLKRFLKIKSAATWTLQSSSKEIQTRIDLREKKEWTNLQRSKSHTWSRSWHLFLDCCTPTPGLVLFGYLLLQQRGKTWAIKRKYTFKITKQTWIRLQNQDLISNMGTYWPQSGSLQKWGLLTNPIQPVFDITWVFIMMGPKKNWISAKKWRLHRMTIINM